jgi:hypothetical protein
MMVVSIRISVLPSEVWIMMGMSSTVIVRPGVRVVDPPITKFPPLGSWSITMFEGPADMVVLGGSAAVVACAGAGPPVEPCCSPAGVSSQPVAVISITGEHPLHGRVALKLGSVIS